MDKYKKEVVKNLVRDINNFDFKKVSPSYEENGRNPKRMELSDLLNRCSIIQKQYFETMNSELVSLRLDKNKGNKKWFILPKISQNSISNLKKSTCNSCGGSVISAGQMNSHVNNTISVLEYYSRTLSMYLNKVLNPKNELVQKEIPSSNIKTIDLSKI